MRRADLITGLALVIIALAFVARITLRHDGGPHEQAPARGAQAAQPANPIGPASLAKARRPAPELQVEIAAHHPDAAALEVRAEDTETEARFRLGLLTRKLALTPDQRREIFPLLARAARDYDPAFLVGGQGPGLPALNDRELSRAIQGHLEPAQRDQLIEDALNEALLWQEIIGKLEEKLREATDAEANLPSGSEEPSTPSATHQGRNLLDLVEP